jgi:hypothetical protein
MCLYGRNLFNAASAAAVIFIFSSQGFSGLEFKNVLFNIFACVYIFRESFFFAFTFSSRYKEEKISDVFNSFFFFLFER